MIAYVSTLYCNFFSWDAFMLILCIVSYLHFRLDNSGRPIKYLFRSDSSHRNIFCYSRACWVIDIHGKLFGRKICHGDLWHFEDSFGRKIRHGDLWHFKFVCFSAKMHSYLNLFFFYRLFLCWLSFQHEWSSSGIKKYFITIYYLYHKRLILVHTEVLQVVNLFKQL